MPISKPSSAWTDFSTSPVGVCIYGNLYVNFILIVEQKCLNSSLLEAGSTYVLCVFGKHRYQADSLKNFRRFFVVILSVFVDGRSLKRALATEFCGFTFIFSLWVLTLKLSSKFLPTSSASSNWLFLVLCNWVLKLLPAFLQSMQFFIFSKMPSRFFARKGSLVLLTFFYRPVEQNVGCPNSIFACQKVPRPCHLEKFFQTGSTDGFDIWNSHPVSSHRF